MGAGKIRGEEVASVGFVPSWDNGLSLRLYCQRRDRQTKSFGLLSVLLLFICVLSVSHVRLGTILAQSRITVPEISGEALGMIRVALRSKRQNMTGFGEESLFSPLPGARHTLAPGPRASLGHLGLRAHRVSPVGVLKVDPAGWKFPPSGLALMDVESWNREGRSRTGETDGGQQRTDLSRSRCEARCGGSIWMANF